MKCAQIILLSIVAACAYGVIHDQVTARICTEYFTIAHPPLFHTTSPTLLALCWGVTATVGIGAVLGVVLALVSQSQNSTPYSVSRLARLFICLLGVMAASACIAGVAGYQLSRQGLISVPPGLSAAIPVNKHDRFMAVWFAHGASYLVGLTGGALLCVWVWQTRGRPSVISLLPQTGAALIRTAVIVAIFLLVIWLRFYSH